MYPRLFHIYGPLYIQSYGFAIAVGILVFIYLFLHHRGRKKLITNEQFYTGLGWVITASLIGGHVWYVLSEYHEIESWYEIFIPWTGLSLLGGIIGGGICAYIYFLRNKIPTWPVLDIIGIYLPLVQCFGRIGCFFAGCCHGITTTVPWAVTYTHPEVQAPCYLPLHPSQLYSAALLGGIFVLMYCVLQYRFKKPGQLFALFIILTSLERFITDFWRADHKPEWYGNFSVNQQLAGILLLLGSTLFIVQTHRKKI
jgi:phosphatidylglycerol:prolipoprotein diacylglycerol transferase